MMDLPNLPVPPMSRPTALLLSLCLSMPLAATAASPVLVLHGGAGVERKDLSPAEEKAARAALQQALLKGHAVLAAGKPALDAVTAAIT
ncbi:isoaspartyl peptidase/L-asparaginase, partial [Roseateles sp. P5_E1]